MCLRFALWNPGVGMLTYFIPLALLYFVTPRVTVAKCSYKSLSTLTTPCSSLTPLHTQILPPPVAGVLGVVSDRTTGEISKIQCYIKVDLYILISSKNNSISLNRYFNRLFSSISPNRLELFLPVTVLPACIERSLRCECSECTVWQECGADVFNLSNRESSIVHFPFRRLTFPVYLCAPGEHQCCQTHRQTTVTHLSSNTSTVQGWHYTTTFVSLLYKDKFTSRTFHGGSVLHVISFQAAKGCHLRRQLRQIIPSREQTRHVAPRDARRSKTGERQVTGTSGRSDRNGTGAKPRMINY